MLKEVNPKAMSNRMIELHDSEIASVEFDAGTAIITFSHAYIHKSDGVPGVDPGTGWSQRAELRIRKASNPDMPKYLPYRIDNGLLRLGDVEHPNEIPIPLSYDGTLTLNLLVADAEYGYNEISITGSGVELKLIGEAEYIEVFSGQRTDPSSEDAT
jgi:hypothetical protein